MLFSTYDLLISGASSGKGKRAREGGAEAKAKPVSKSIQGEVDHVGVAVAADGSDEEIDEFGEEFFSPSSGCRAGLVALGSLNHKPLWHKGDKLTLALDKMQQLAADASL